MFVRDSDSDRVGERSQLQRDFWCHFRILYFSSDATIQQPPTPRSTNEQVTHAVQVITIPFTSYVRLSNRMSSNRLCWFAKYTSLSVTTDNYAVFCRGDPYDNFLTFY